MEPHQAVEAGVVSYSLAVFVNSKWVDIIYFNLFFVCVSLCVFFIQFLANQEFVRARTFLRKLEVSVWRVFQTANCHTKEVIKSVTIFLVVTKDKRDFDSGTINMMHQGDLLLTS